jgi:hypothetical protein
MNVHYVFATLVLEKKLIIKNIKSRRMKSYYLLVISFCSVLILGTSCSRELSKEEEFEEFVNSELNGPGKEQKVKKFILDHYSFSNQEDLYFEGKYDTNHVCVFIEFPLDREIFSYSFRLVKSNPEEDYSEGFKVYCTAGESKEVYDNDFKKLAFFLYNENKKIKEQFGSSYPFSSVETMDSVFLVMDRESLVSLKKRIEVANLNLIKQGLKKVNYALISKRIDHSGFLKLKNGKKSPILNALRLLSWENIGKDVFESVTYVEAATRYMKNNNFNTNLDNYKTDFIEKCEDQKFENCNEPHSTNLFIHYKGTYYGIDQWEKFL